jgi:phosphonoacetaldehyde hydrolase
MNPYTVRLVIFDWAGTTVDHGCFAPVAPFVDALAHFGVQVTLAEAREPMGVGKRDHLRAILSMPRVAELWRTVHGHPWSEADVDRVYQEQFIPRQLESVRQHCQLIPGVLESVAWLRERGIKIGTTTGYFAEAAESAWQAGAAQGYLPDHNVAPNEVPAGRPAPWMIYRNMEALGIYPPVSVLKIGDTAPDIEEGLAAGVWSVGVTHTGSDVGCTAGEFAALAPAEREARANRACQKLLSAGAHFVVNSVADVPKLITYINGCLAEGELPHNQSIVSSTFARAR